jgi:SAM-dependent methyltransferase
VTPLELRRVAFDFRVARALYAGVEIGLFDAIGRGARTPQELAARMAADPRALRILLEALAGAGVLERSGDAFAIAPALVASLVSGEPDYLGNLLLHDLWHWTSWAHLGRVLREGAPHKERGGDPHLTSPEVLRRFLPNFALAMDQSGGDATPRLASQLARLAPRAILDLGGGSGRELEALLGLLPAARGAVAERAFALEAARERLGRSRVAARARVVALDFERDPIPGGYDLILLSRVLMGLPDDAALRLVRACAAALAPGGTLAIHDYDARSRVGALLSLDMLLLAGAAVHPSATLLRWLAEAGLRAERPQRVLPYTRLWLGRRAAA